MTNRVPPRAPLSTLPAAARLQLALPARPPYLALRPSSACTAPSSPHHARPPSRLAKHPLSKSHRGPPLPAGMRAAVHTRDTCRHQASCDGARAQPASPLCGLGRRVHTCGRESPSRLRRPALLLHAARRVPAPSTLHAALYTARAHPTAPYGAIPLPTSAEVTRSRSSLSSVQPS